MPGGLSGDAGGDGVSVGVGRGGASLLRLPRGPSGRGTAGLSLAGGLPAGTAVVERDAPAPGPGNMVPDHPGSDHPGSDHTGSDHTGLGNTGLGHPEPAVSVLDAAPPVIPGAGVAGPAGGADPVVLGARPVAEARLYSSCTYPGPDPAGLVSALSALAMPEVPAAGEAAAAGAAMPGPGPVDAASAGAAAAGTAGDETEAAGAAGSAAAPAPGEFPGALLPGAGTLPAAPGVAALLSTLQLGGFAPPAPEALVRPGGAAAGSGGTGSDGTGSDGTGSGGDGSAAAGSGNGTAPDVAALADPEALQHAGLVRRDTLAPLPYVLREWGDGSYPPLYCPPTVRIDDDLAAEVNRRLVTWAEKVGIHAGRMDKFRETGFGRLAMLTHPDTDDPDRLLVAAQMNAAWWAADDYYADETPLGATPTELPPRLALVMSAMDPPPAAGKYTGQLNEAIAADPVLVALNSATAHLSRHATPSQVMRACNTTFQMYVSWTAYAAWRYLGELPPVWRYLAARQHDSFYTSMTLIDIVAGYHLPANLFYDRRFHRALMPAGTASVLVNDLHSVAREAADEMPDSNVVLLIAAEENCSIREATMRTVALHNDFVRGFEVSQRQLASVPSLEMQRFLRGAQAWMGGCLEWHATSSRYQ